MRNEEKKYDDIGPCEPMTQFVTFDDSYFYLQFIEKLLIGSSDIAANAFDFFDRRLLKIVDYSNFYASFEFIFEACPIKAVTPLYHMFTYHIKTFK